MRVISRGIVWGLGLIAEFLLVYDVLLINMQTHAWFTGCTVGTGDIVHLQLCTPVLPPLTITLPTGGPLFSNGFLVLLLALLIGVPAWIAEPVLARRRGASARAPLLIISLPASACATLCLVSVLVRPFVLTATETCFWSPQVQGQLAVDPSCTVGGSAPVFAMLGVAFLPLLATCVLTVPTWVMGLTETDRQQRWMWYFAVLFLSPVAATLYGLFGGGPNLLFPHRPRHPLRLPLGHGRSNPAGHPVHD